MLKRTAILFFSRLPQEELLGKKLTENNKNSFAIWQHLYSQSLAAATKTGFPLILWSEKEQYGKNFAEKITHGISTAFKNGYDNLIVIGSDTPNLSTAHLNFAKNELQSGRQIVAGKDMRGGIYLLALNKSAFSEDIFLKFSWQTNNLFKEICCYGNGFNFSQLSAVLFDINSKADALKSVSLFYIKNAFRYLLLNISCLLQIQEQKKIILKGYPVPVQTNILRGPPSGV